MEQPITISGSGFLPGEPVTLLLLIDNIDSHVIGGPAAEQPVANAAGAFSAGFDSIRGDGDGERNALDRAPGASTVRAVGEDGSRAAVPIMITSDNAPVTSVASSLAVNRKLVRNQETNGLDVTITVYGAGFIPGEAVTVTIIEFERGGVDKILVGGTANDSGAFVLEGTLVGESPAEGDDPMLPIAPGVYTVLAEGAYGSGATGPMEFGTKQPY